MNYCDEIENIILKAFLNIGTNMTISNFKLPELMVSQESSYLAGGFIQRLPWSITASYNQYLHSQPSENLSLKTSILMQSHQIVLSGFLQKD